MPSKLISRDKSALPVIWPERHILKLDDQVRGQLEIYIADGLK
jgi:hypothetical protein